MSNSSNLVCVGKKKKAVQQSWHHKSGGWTDGCGSGPVIFPAPLAPIFPADTTTSLSSVSSAFCHSTTIPTTILASLPSVASASSVIQPWERIFSGCCWSLSGGPPHPKLLVTCLPADILQPDITCFQGLNNRWNAPPREKKHQNSYQNSENLARRSIPKTAELISKHRLESVFHSQPRRIHIYCALLHQMLCGESHHKENTSRFPQTGIPMMTKEAQFLPKDCVIQPSDLAANRWMALPVTT